ncbi:AAA family ATPase [Micromonospora sp. NPDC003197]
MTSGILAGRQDLVDQALHHWADGRSVVLVGGAGMGKSTVLAALGRAAGQRPGLVLVASPAEADARMPFVTLIDLFGAVPGEHFDRLSPATLRIVELALRRRDPGGGEVDTLAVCLGILDLLRTITSAMPITLLLDDLQWVDPASAEVLSFAARRLPLGRMTILAAQRSDTAAQQPPAGPVVPPGVVTLAVGPLPAEVLVPVITARAGGLVSRPIAQQIWALSAGNPLFALEISDAVRRSGVRPEPGAPLPVPVHLDTLMRQRLATLSPRARDTVRLAATAYRPTLALLSRAGCDAAVTDLTDASVAGICDLDASGTVSFGHPLLRAAVYAEAPVIVRMSLHARLVEVTTDPIERARHLALATGLEDETVAAALTTAADLASRRGATGVARELIGLAALRTPTADQVGWAERKLAEAHYAHQAGLLSEAREVAGQVLAAEVPRRLRIRAWLAVFEASGDAIGGMGQQVSAAREAAAGEADLEPRVRLYCAIHHAAALRAEPALADAGWAAEAAAVVGDGRTEAWALHVLLTVKAQLGQSRDVELARVGRLLAQRRDLGEAAHLICYDLARAHFDDDRYDEAHELLRSAVRRAEEAGVFGGLEWVLHLLARVDWRRGRCTAALATVSRFQQLAIDVEPAYGNLVRWASAEAEAVTGSLGRAIELAEQVVTETERIGDVEKLIQFCHFLGSWRHFAGDDTGALAMLDQAREHAANFAPGNQSVLLLAELVEVRVGVGDREQARQLLTELRDLAARFGRGNETCGDGDAGTSTFAAAAAQRAEAVFAFAEGRADAAIDLLSRAAEAYRALDTPLELARTLTVWANVARRQRRRAAARTLLDEAARRCEAAGATVWRDRVEAELARLTPGGRAGNQLTPMEERIAALVVQGATNREIAQSLAIGVTTVEGSLTQIYRRFRIRSRVELVRALTS